MRKRVIYCVSALQFSQEPLNVQSFGKHTQSTLVVPGPGFPGTVPIKFHPIAIWIITVNGFRDPMIRKSSERISRFHQAFQDRSQISADRKQNGCVKKSGRALRSRRCIFAVPGIQANMVMVATCRKKNSISSIPLSDLKAQQVLVEFQRSRDIGHFEVHMTNAGRRGYGVIQG